MASLTNDSYQEAEKTEFHRNEWIDRLPLQDCRGLKDSPFCTALRCIESKWYNQPKLHSFPLDSHEMCAIFWILDVFIGHFYCRLFIFLPEQTLDAGLGT